MTERAPADDPGPETASPLGRFMRFCLENKLVVGLALVFVVSWGIAVAPFDWRLGGLPRNPVPVDAIPDIGENQQIVFTEWMGRSPRDVEDQITYPLTASLLGMPGVKTVRSYSLFGFSSIYVIFQEDVDFYWSRSRVLEKLSSLPSGTLPEGVRPTLGPDATALGQVYWYTLEGRDPEGKPTGGWDLNELRTFQDWHVRYALLGAQGISEVASVGGFVQEYQIDVDPDAMRAHGVALDDVFNAVRMSNTDVGARTIEVNRVEYVIRGLGFVRGVPDLEQTVVKVNQNVPIYVKDVARVALGPAVRRGALDKGGAEAVGGVAVVRYGFNPLEAIRNLKEKIAEIEPGLPKKAVVDFALVGRADVEAFAQARGFDAFDGAVPDQEAWLAWLASTPRADWPAWLTLSQLRIVPFYDRTGLIHETLGTLNTALRLEIMVTIIVVLVAVWHLRSSLLISGALPLTVLLCFIAMKVFGVDANVVALSGIAIAIGTIVDMSIVICENILRHLDEAPEDANRLEVVYRASAEVGGAVLTAVSTTVIGFLPVFLMTGPEGKLFRPLAFTKTFALLASVVIALAVVPAGAHLLLGSRVRSDGVKRFLLGGLVAAGLCAGMLLGWWWLGSAMVMLGLYGLAAPHLPVAARRAARLSVSLVAVIAVGVLLTREWLPLGVERGMARNALFVGGLTGGLILLFFLVRITYVPALRWCLAHKVLFLVVPMLLVVGGLCSYAGFERVFGFVPAAVGAMGGSPERVMHTRFWVWASGVMPGLGREFMPPLDEGSFLYMPTTMAHASIGEALDIVQKQDQAFAAIPAVESAVGKIGRAETPLDPAPVSMVETVINYRPEYITDDDGRRLLFRYDEERGAFDRDQDGELVPDPEGRPYRQWPDHIRSPDDIWDEIEKAGRIPGTTSAPKLQPIAARIVMLQSGMRAPMGVKVKGPDLESIEQVGLQIERLLKEVPGVEPTAVIADRIVGKPYLEIAPNREDIARYGLHMRQVQDVIEVAIGGMRVTTTVEGRERFPVRVRYMRELSDRIDLLGRILVPTPVGAQVPLAQLAEIRYVRGPQAIKSEDNFLIGYVLFDKRPEYAEVDVVQASQRYLEAKRESGELVLPAGVSYAFAGTYENQVRARRTLTFVLPIALLLIFIVLYFQFRSATTAGLVFSSIFVAWAGGFLLIGLYGQPWFLDFRVLGVDMRALFQVHPLNMSVAVWVGFLALFGIASDNGVVIGTYLRQSFARRDIRTVADIREATVAGAVRRIRACLMTSATTILALLPVLTATGRGSDIMVPMAIPSFGGMVVVLVSAFMVPVLFCAVEECRHAFTREGPSDATSSGA